MNQEPCRRSVATGIVLLALMAASQASAQAAEERETIQLAVGSSRTIALTENPSTGYGWRLNQAASSNLSLVEISDAGFEAGGGKLVGAPGTRRFRLVARQPGAAVAIFDYARPWEHVPAVRRYVINIDISGR